MLCANRNASSTALVAKIDGLDEPLVAEMIEGLVVSIEILLGHDTEGADAGQCSAIVAVQFVDAITIDEQLALFAAWQIEVAHQSVVRIVIVPVALVVDARPLVAAIPLTELTWITPSSVGHRFLLVLGLVPGCP